MTTSPPHAGRPSAQGVAVLASGEGSMRARTRHCLSASHGD